MLREDLLNTPFSPALDPSMHRLTANSFISS